LKFVFFIALMSKNAFKCSKDLSLGTIVAKYIFFATGFFESAIWVSLVEKCIFCDIQAGVHRIDHDMKVRNSWISRYGSSV